MRSTFLSVLIGSFLSVFALSAWDFHCSGSELHQDTHQHASQNTEADADHDADHEGCPPHMHSCCTNVFVFQKESQIFFPLDLKIVFSENTAFLKPAPILEGPFQPPRLS